MKRFPMLSLLLVSVLFLLGCILFAFEARRVVAGAAVPTDPAVVQDQASTHRAHQDKPIMLTMTACAIGLFLAAYTSTVTTADGWWDEAGNWSAGVPTLTTSAIISGFTIVLPERTSALTKNISGTGKIGVAGGGVNTLKVASATANYVMNFTSVDLVLRKTATTETPYGTN